MITIILQAEQIQQTNFKQSLALSNVPTAYSSHCSFRCLIQLLLMLIYYLSITAKAKHRTTPKKGSGALIKHSGRLQLIACFYHIELAPKRFISLKTYYYQPLNLTDLITSIRRSARNTLSSVSSAGGFITDVKTQQFLTLLVEQEQL